MITETIIDNRISLGLTHELSTIEDKGTSPLLKAIERNNKDIVKILIDHKANIKLEDTRGNIALTIAAQNNHLEIVKIITNTSKADDNINHQNKYGNTPLMYAIQNKNKNMVKLLIEANKNGISLINKKGQTAKNIALDLKYYDIASMIEEASK